MRRLFLEFFAAVSLTFAAAVTSVSGAQASDMMVMKPYARASTMPTAKTGAIYVVLMNHGTESDRLLSVSTPAAAMAHLHKTENVDGVMKMEPVEALEIPVHGMVEMKPGGYHIMLMGLKQPLKEGEEIDLSLHFEKAGDVEVKVPVGGVAATGE